MIRISENNKNPEELKELISKRRKRQKFERQNSRKHKRMNEKWRKPKGSHSKVRRELKNKKSVPKSGRRSPKEIRGVHPSGYKDVLINKPKDLKDLDPEKEAVRIAGGVGKKKREKISEEAEKKDIKILNG